MTDCSMEKLIILDYTNSSVDIYNVDENANIDESYIRDLGYDSNCLWMFSVDPLITYHEEVLK